MNSMWKDLSIKDKSSLMRTFIRNGVTSLNEMKRMYDNGGAKGGYGRTTSVEGGIVEESNYNPFIGLRTTKNRAYDPNLVNYSYNYLQDKGVPEQQARIMASTMVEESGGNPFSKSENGTYQGVLQWGKDRYVIPQYPKVPSSIDTLNELNRQLDYILSTKDNTTDKVSWTHGGEGSGYDKGVTAHSEFVNGNPTQAFRAYSYGYVRPKGKEDSYRNRLKVFNQVNNNISNQLTGPYGGGEGGGARAFGGNLFFTGGEEDDINTLLQERINSNPELREKIEASNRELRELEARKMIERLQQEEKYKNVSKWNKFLNTADLITAGIDIAGDTSVVGSIPTSLLSAGVDVAQIATSILQGDMMGVADNVKDIGLSFAGPAGSAVKTANNLSKFVPRYNRPRIHLPMQEPTVQIDSSKPKRY